MNTRLSSSLALLSVSMELRLGNTVNTTANRKIHHCSDTRNVISDLRRFYGIEIISDRVGYTHPITGRGISYIDSYRLDKTVENLAKMDDLIRVLADEVENLRIAYSLKQEKSNKAA